MSILIKSFDIPESLRKKTNLGITQFYEKLEIYDDKTVGYNNGNDVITWFYKDYININHENANLNSQFARITFSTSAQGNKKVLLVGTTTNVGIQGDMNKILFCSGMFSYKAANEFSKEVYNVLYKTFIDYKQKGEETSNSSFSEADEISKFKDLLDKGVISQEEFEAKKKQLLGL